MLRYISTYPSDVNSLAIKDWNRCFSSSRLALQLFPSGDHFKALNRLFTCEEQQFNAKIHISRGQAQDCTLTLRSAYAPPVQAGLDLVQQTLWTIAGSALPAAFTEGLPAHADMLVLARAFFHTSAPLGGHDDLERYRGLFLSGPAGFFVNEIVVRVRTHGPKPLKFDCMTQVRALDMSTFFYHNKRYLSTQE